MTQAHTAKDSRTTTKSKGDESLYRIRAAVQELHAAISDATAKRGKDVKDDLQSIPHKSKAVVASVKESLSRQDDASKKHLTQAVTHLEAIEQHIAESLKATGHAFETSVREALADAHAAAQKVSEAVAVQRTASQPQT